MNLYKNHTLRELQVILNQSAKLTYAAQCNLLQELLARSVALSTIQLEAQIQEKETAIQSLSYLNDLGFVYNKDGNTITIKRSPRSTMMDVIAIFLGLVLFLIGLVYFWHMFAMFFGDNAFTLSKIFTYTLMISLGAIGFKMLGGVNRFLDYNSFLLLQSGSIISVNKGSFKGTQEVALTQLNLEKQSGELILYAGSIEIMRCTADNLAHKKTVAALMQKMMENQ